MIKAAVTVLVLCAVLSCSDDTAVMAELDRAEAVMEEYPDSALALLDTLDRGRLTTREARARHGSHDYRLMTQYYLGRIYQNAGDNESAMRCFVQAERYLSDADTNQYADKMITAANISLLLKDTVKIHEYLSKVRLVFRSISDEEKGYYFGEYLASLPKNSVRLN